MSITLWGRKSSCNVQKVLWALEETHTPYTHITLGGKDGGLDDPAFLKRNPHGRVPTLQDGHLIVWESDAIVRYVSAQYGAGTLWQETAQSRAIADQWMCWAAASLYRDWIDLFWRHVRTPAESRDAEVIARHHARTIKNYHRLDQHLADHNFIAGQSLSFADISIGMTLYRWFTMDIERPSMPNLEAYYARLQERPAYQSGICIPYDDLIGRTSY